MIEFFKSLVSNKKRLAAAVAIFLIAVFGIYKIFHKTSAQTSYILAQSSKQTIIASISGSGQVSQDRTVSITPVASGKLISVNVKQGQAVKAGQTLAIVDETSNTVALNQARASLASAQANYDQVAAGATSQDIQLAQLGVQADQQALANAKTNLGTVKAQQDLAVNTALNNFLNSGLAATPSSGNSGSVTPTISGNYQGTDQGQYKISIYSTGAGLRYQVSGLEANDGPISSSPQPIGTKGLYVSFSGSNIPSNDSWAVNLPNPQATGYSSSNNSYQSALNTRQSSVNTAQNQIDSAENKLEQDQINLSVKQQPPNNQQLSSAKAQLISAEAQYQNAQISYSNNILKAPFDGTVAQLNSQAGDQVTGSTVVAMVITKQSLAVIPLNEVDVSKIKLDDKANLTFDAVDGLTITGKVVQIDSIGTASQGVVSYNTKVAFDTEDERVKPGMSVNVSIITAVETDVLSVPNSAIKSQNGASFVLLLDPKDTQSQTGQPGVIAKTAPKQTPVEIGLADDTNTEIISGINQGDSVVAQTISSAATSQTSATSGTNLFRLGGGGGNATFRAAGGAATGR